MFEIVHDETDVSSSLGDNLCEIHKFRALDDQFCDKECPWCDIDGHQPLTRDRIEAANKCLGAIISVMHVNVTRG